MANLKKEAKIVAKQDNQNYAVTVETLQSFLRDEPYTKSLIPDKDVAYDLGSAGVRWRDIYLSGNSIHLGGIVLSDDGQGRLHVENEVNPTQEVSFDLSTSLISDLKDVNTSGVTEGQILKWNPASQQWMASDEVSSSLKFHGVIGTEPGEILAPDGSETEGDFYLVHGTHQISGWAGIADNTEVTNQDMVVKGATDFSLLTGIIGGGGSGVTTIVSETDALVVDNTLPAAPKLSILNATETEDGLMASEDKVRLDELSDGLSDVKFDSIAPYTVGDDFTASDQNQVHIVKEPDVANPSGVVFDWNRELDSSSVIPSDRTYSVVPADGGFGLGTVDKPFDYLYSDLVNANKFDLKQYVNINPNLSDPFVKVTNFLPRDENGVEVNTEQFGLEFSLDRGNTYKNQLKVSTRLGDIVKITGGTRPEINFGTNFKDGDIDLGTGKEKGVLIKGVVTPNDTSPNTQVANKGYVDSKIIKSEILALGTYSTDLIINRNVDDAFLDRENNRYLMWRNYFGERSMTKQPHLIIVDATTNQVEYKEVINPIAAGNRRESISCPFKIGDHQFFVQAENPKDSAPLKLEDDGTFAEFGDLKMCQDWAIINYHVKLSDRYRLFMGNPQLRIDRDGGNHSQQAQVTLLLDTEDLINQNEVESFLHSGDGQTYGTCTKRINKSRGGIPAVIDKGEGNIPDVYQFQSGKPIAKFNFNDLESKDVTLTTIGEKLPVGYLVDHGGKFIEEKGRINGLTVFQNRYVIFHSHYDALYCFDTDDDTLTELVSMTNNSDLGQWVKYGINNQRLTPAVPNFNDTLYYFPESPIGDDGFDNDPKLIIVHKDLTLEYVDIPYDDWECTNSQKVNEYEIVCTNKNQKVFVFDTRDNSFSRFTSNEKLNTIYEGLDPEGNTKQRILPWVSGNNIDDTSFKDCNIQEITKVVDPEYIADLDLLQNDIIKDHDEALQALKHNDSLISTRDGLADLISPEVHLATEDETYKQPNLMEFCSPCWPDEDHPHYQLISQDYVLFHRMYEGSKKTEDDAGNILSNNQTLDSDDYGNDDLKNLMIFHIPTGKIKDISILVSHNDTAVDIDGNAMDKYPSLRGKTVIPRSNGDVDVYSWIHNPRRKGISQPLVRIHIPANPDPSDPFANVTTNHTNIKCDLSLLTTPDKNPYGNFTNEDLKFQYEINQLTWDLVDQKTSKRHHFMMSYNKGSKDYVTQRIFEINFDDSDPDEGTITPVDAHVLSTNGSFAAGLPAIKKDITGKNRCFLYGSPCALTELYFTGDDLLQRTVEMRNYGEFIPQGNKVYHSELVNGMGQKLIKERGIYDNWYKSTTLNPQFLTLSPIDNDDYFTNIIVWYQGAYGVCSLNIQDLGVYDRQAETKFENNYQGSDEELSSIKFAVPVNIYMSYIQDGSAKNLTRFTTKIQDTHSHGKLYYFDYKNDYVYDIDNNGDITSHGSEKKVYNVTRKYDVDGNLTEQWLYKNSVLEVSPNYDTGLIEIRAIITGKKHYPSGNEPGYPGRFSAESVVKFGDVFVCSGSSRSNSHVINPKVYIFDPRTRSIQKVSDTQVDSLSLISCPQHGLVIGSSYGMDIDDNNTPVHLTTMTANPSVMQDRKTARTLRKLYAVTGDSVANDPDTWSEDPAQTGLSTPNPSDFDSNESEWDPQDLVDLDPNPPEPADPPVDPPEAPYTVVVDSGN